MRDGRVRRYWMGTSVSGIVAGQIMAARGEVCRDVFLHAGYQRGRFQNKNARERIPRRLE
jgi:hypothetical protein